MTVCKCVGCGCEIEACEVACEACMSVPRSPCRQCSCRVISPNCHDTCRRYLIRVSVDRALKSRDVGREADMVTYANRNKSIRRQQRKVNMTVHNDWRN